MGFSFSYMIDCIFCRIAGKEIRSYTVYEDNHSLAFLDIHPHAKGHTVIIPKVHAQTIFDLNDELVKEFFSGLKATMDRVDHVLSPDGYNIGWNHGETGGQVVGHLHVHIMPRWQGDGGKSQHAIINNPGDAPVAEIAKLFEGY